MFKMKVLLSILVLSILTAILLHQPLIAQSPSEVQSKLKALEAAHEAGILNDEEYARKKAELEAQLQAATPPMDEATRQKLQALETAHEAGILSDEEYARKKAELLGQQTAPVAGSGANLVRYSDPRGRFHFQHPPDWKIQYLEGENGVALTRGQAALNVMPLPDGATAQQVVDSIVEQISGAWQNYRELGRGQRNIGGVTSPMVEFTGINLQGMNAHSQATVFVSGVTGYLFILVAPEIDPQNSFAAVQPVWGTLLSSFTLAGQRIDTGPKGKIYRHAAGFSFWYPESWSVSEQEGILQLTPPDAASTAEGPSELYFVAAEDVSGNNIQRPDDPMLLEYLDMQVQSLSPALNRTGSGTPVDTKAGKGVILDWGAQGTGGEVRARAFVSIIKNYSVILLGMGLKEKVEARDADLRRIFASLGFGEPQPAAAETYGQEPAGTASSSAISANEAGDPNWGFKFRVPEGWGAQKTGEYILLGHNTIAGVIFVLPHTEQTLQQVQAQMQSGLSEEGVQLFPSGALQPLGNNAVAGEYSGVFNGQQAKARGIGTASPYGGGAYIVGLATLDKYSRDLSNAADAIARGMQYFKMDSSDLVRHFSGTWVSMTKSTMTTITLAPDGSYYYGYEAGYSGGFGNQYGDQTGSWGTAREDTNRGRWTIRGNKQNGVIMVTFQDGTESTLEYQVHVEKGQTYWNEYFIDGELYGRKTD